MKTLLILRHAKSSWENSNLIDYERPLNKRGKRDAPRMGRLLQEEALVPDLIITSSAERALATAEAVALAAGYDAEIQTTRRLYHAAPETYIDVLQAVDEAYGRVMVVGHNPGMAELLAVLTGAEKRMPTAALAQVALPIDGWQALHNKTAGTLLNFWRPKELPF